MTDDEAITLILEEEGGLADNPADPGGITHFGITIPAYTDYLRATTGNAKAVATRANILALTVGDARQFYRWLMRKHLWQIQDVDIRYCVFDAAVNMGIKPAIRLLQRALVVPDDGALGPLTVAALPRGNGQLQVFALAWLFCCEQMLFYGRLSSGNLTDRDRDGIPDNLEFLNGWLARLARKMRRFA